MPHDVIIALVRRTQGDTLDSATPSPLQPHRSTYGPYISLRCCTSQPHSIDQHNVRMADLHAERRIVVA